MQNNNAKISKNPDNSIRSLRISVKTVKNQWSESHFPKCTLVGAWLRTAGFEIGDMVTVEVEEGKLTIFK